MPKDTASIFYNGPIITLEDAPVPEALLAENRKIKALGSLSQLHAAAPYARLIDLKGRALLPAFIDTHSHFFQVAMSLLQISLAKADSLEEVISLIQEGIRRQQPGPGQWILVRDFDQSRIPGGRRPTLAQLDEAAPNHPLIIQHQSGHMGFFNSAALSLLQVTPRTPVPEGGIIEQCRGALTGYM